MSGAPGANHPTTAVYAGFWRRVGAFLIDYVILLAASVVAVFLLSESQVDDPMFAPFMMLAWFAYKVAMESSRYQATVGKLAIGIQVTDAHGNRISVWRAIGRFFASFLSGLILYIGFLMAGFTRRRQALHDMIAGTLVVRKGLAPAAVASAGDAPPVSGWGIAALVVVGAGVPFMGVVAAIAIPAYQDYTIRSQVFEGLNLASAHKAAVAETWDAGQLGFPDMDSSTAGGEALARSGKYVESIEITSGVVTITYGSAAATALNGRTLALVPALDENQEIAWVCGYGGAPAGYEVIFEDHARFTDVPAKFLPMTCRGS